MKYFLYGYYGFGNYGDDLLLGVLLTRIRAADPDARFVVRARAPVAAFSADPRVEFLLAEHILEEQQRSRASRFYRYTRAMCSAARECDVFVIGGGTLFIDKGKPNWSLLFIHQAVRAAKRVGRRVVVSGVAIDILAHPLSLWLTRRIFAMADFSAVRDALSLAYFQDWERPPRLAADLAWLQALPSAAASPGRRRTIGLNFIDYYRTSASSVAGHQALRESLAGLVERYRGQMEFRLIALQKGIGQRDDWFLEEFRQLVPEGQIDYIDDLESLEAALAAVDGVIATRFHLALLAARRRIPTCIVDHELKLTSLAQDLALPTLPLAEFIQGGDADPIQRLARFDAEATGQAAARMAARAELNFSWMQQ
jgi:polysaccharide pyruvyl transferase WcaK-like protein